ncbi:MAG: hypothetical protein LBP33_06215 [Candidatus Adiutrix sp.]|jgi:hypothetical protein|nr:hypothetical protein [Candidatus Adiutrix sp.]
MIRELYKFEAPAGADYRLTFNPTANVLDLRLDRISTDQDGQKVYTLERMYGIALSRFRQLNGWGDCTLWQVLFVLPSGYAITNPDAESYVSKSTLFLPHFDCYPFNVLVKTIFADDDFNAMNFTVSIPAAWEFKSDTQFLAKTSFQKSRDKFLAMALDGPDEIQAGGGAELTLSCLLDGQPAGKPLTVYLTHSNGYLPKTKLTVTGSGNFKVMALGLAPGDEIEVKAGHKYWTNVVSKTLKVVA